MGALTAHEHAQLRLDGASRLRTEWAGVTPEMFDEGMAWYAEMSEWAQGLATAHSLTFEQVAGVAATLSPRINWQLAQRATEEMLRGDQPRGPFPRQVVKARRILDGANVSDVISGQKVTAFWRNIMGDLDSATIDTWSSEQVSGLDYTADKGSKFLERKGVYETFSGSFRDVATEIGVEAAQLQAILWVKVRGRK